MGWTKRVVAALALIALGFVSASAQAPRKVALIIANADYGDADANLPNAPIDADMVARALKAVGFDVEALSDLGNGDMRAALAAFQQKADGAEVGLVYFAGHGMEAGGKNWLVPVDARLTTDAQLDSATVDANSFIAGTHGAKTRIVILDACRNNPFAQSMRSTGTYMVAQQGGLSGLDVQTQDDVLVMFSAGSGKTASDGVRGRGSPFARAFAQHVTEEGAEFRLVAGKIARSVRDATEPNQQTPFTSMSLLGGEPIYLAGPPAFTVEAAIARRQEEEARRQMLTLLQREVRTGPGGTALLAAQGRTLSMSSISSCGRPDFGGEAPLLDAGLAQAELLRVALSCQRFAVDPQSTALGAFYASYFAGKAFRLTGDLPSAERTLLAVANSPIADSRLRGPNNLTPTRGDAELLLAKVFAAQARKADAIAMLARANETYSSLLNHPASRPSPALRRLAQDGVVNVALTNAETLALPPRDDVGALVALTPLLDARLEPTELVTNGRQQIAEAAVALGEARLQEGSSRSLQEARYLFERALNARLVLRADASREFFLLGVTMMRVAGLAGPDDPLGCKPSRAIDQPVLQQALAYFNQAGGQSGRRWEGCALTALGNLDAAMVAFTMAGDEVSKGRLAELMVARDRPQ